MLSVGPRQLQNFLHFDENNTVTIGEGDTAVKIVFKADEYHIMEDDKTIATVSDIIDLQVPANT